jgi:hypothetical protein
MILKHFISYLFSSLCVALHCFFWAQRVSSGLLCMSYYLGSDGNCNGHDDLISIYLLPVTVNCKLSTVPEPVNS